MKDSSAGVINQEYIRGSLLIAIATGQPANRILNREK